MKQLTRKPRLYRLKSQKTPLSLLISSRHTRHKSLIYYDEEKQINRTLRYATNQKSIFEDEQDGTTIVGSIVFEDGFLSTKAEDNLLQTFLSLHPDNGTLFEEVDPEHEAKDDLEYLDLEIEALIAVKELDIEQLATLGRILIGPSVNSLKSNELKRDMYLYAKNNCAEFLDALDNDDLHIDALVAKVFDQGLLQYRPKKREIYYNFPTNKKRLMVVPFREDKSAALISYLHTDEGMELLDVLENMVK